MVLPIDASQMLCADQSIIIQNQLSTAHRREMNNSFAVSLFRTLQDFSIFTDLHFAYHWNMGKIIVRGGAESAQSSISNIDICSSNLSPLSTDLPIADSIIRHLARKGRKIGLSMNF